MYFLRDGVPHATSQILEHLDNKHSDTLTDKVSVIHIEESVCDCESALSMITLFVGGV